MKKQLLVISFLSAAAALHAQNVGIGISTPDASAKLDINSTNSGLLIPRVALTMTNAAGPIAAPVTSLLVYNTATAGDVTPGFYYWDGSKWVRLADKSGWDLSGNTGITAANFLGTINAADLIIRTNNAERMRVLSGGNVGIGDASPAALLTVGNGDLMQVVSTGHTRTINGTAAAPSFSFTGDTDNGVYLSAADQLSFASNATEAARFTSAQLFHLTANGSAAAPSIAWTTDPNTGIFHSALVDDMGFTTGGTQRMWISDAGEVYVGATAPVLPGDMFSATASNINAVTSGSGNLSWAINGYTAYNGAGVYGRTLTGNTTNFGSIQGEYYGSGTVGSGVRGLHASTTAGTSFPNSGSGVLGANTASGAYKFGVLGFNQRISIRTGGVFGNTNNFAWGGLAYTSSASLDYSVYGFSIAFTTGTAAGRAAGGTGDVNNTAGGWKSAGTEELAFSNHIGLGIYGGVMGGWVRGIKYGFHTKGETYSMYIDGKGYTNKPLAYLIPADKERVATYMTTAMQPEVSAKGKTALQGGKIYVAFDDKFKSVISGADDLIITATPQGNSKGVFISNITTEGFWITENQEGESNVAVSWMAVAPVKGEEQPSVDADLMSNDFDAKMNGVMFNDYDEAGTAQPIWWDGKEIRWDAVPAIKENENFLKKFGRQP